MTRKFVVVGNSHSHGGRVIVGADAARIGGIPIARLGDAAVCQLHGQTHIASASGKLRIDGKQAAVDGDKLACGGSLIAGQTQAGSE